MSSETGVREEAEVERGESGEPERWELIRDVLVFQAKLVIDGLRDLLLSPISIAAALAGVLLGGGRPGRYFYDLLRVGRQSDDWINLFGTRVTGDAIEDHEGRVDSYFDRIEDALVQQVARGGITASAKEALDRALDSVQETIDDSRARPQSTSRTDREVNPVRAASLRVPRRRP